MSRKPKLKPEAPPAIAAPSARVAIYARVSTVDQKCEMQLTELGEFAGRMGWAPTPYIEKESTRRRRPVLEQLLRDAGQRKFDVVLVWKLDRFGRSVQEVVANIQALDRAGIRFMSPSQSIDTDQRNPTSRLLLHILASVAEFERDLIRERVNAGVKSYRDAYKAGRVGKDRHSKSGKDLPSGRPRKIFDRDKALALHAAGHSIRAIAASLGVGIGTVHRLFPAKKR